MENVKGRQPIAWGDFEIPKNIGGEPVIDNEEKFYVQVVGRLRVLSGISLEEAKSIAEETILDGRIKTPNALKGGHSTRLGAISDDWNGSWDNVVNLNEG